MPSIFEFSEYKDFLVKLIESKGEARGFQSQMAKAMNCQAAYLSQVLRGKVELTEDHGIKLTRFLKLNSLEADYFLILLRKGRAASVELREYLEEKRLEMVSLASEMNSKVGAKRTKESEEFLALYFGSSLYSTIHIATSSKNFQTVEALAERFALPRETIMDTLKFLVKHSLVKVEGDKYIFSGESVHLPRSSSLHWTHQVSERLKTIRAIEQKRRQDLHFSSVFTIDRKHVKSIQEILNKAIEDSHKVIHHSGTEEVYTLVMDFFQSP